MPTWLASTLALFVAGCGGPADAPTRQCGVQDAAIKAGRDPEAAQVARSPVATTINALGAIPASERMDSRRSAPEFRVYRVQAAIVSARRERDGDLHLVLTDGDDTLVAEIPSLDCGAATGAFGEEIFTARSYGLRNMRGWNRHHGRSIVTIEGVGYFDREHGQTGASRNGFELHPVLRICSGLDCLWR